MLIIQSNLKLIALSAAWLCLLFAPGGNARAEDLAATTRTQVRVEARVLEWVTDDNLHVDFAVRYKGVPGSSSILENADLTLPSDPSLGSAGRFFFDNMDAGDRGSFDGVIETLETVGTTKILARPSIILTAATNQVKGLSTSAAQPAITEASGTPVAAGTPSVYSARIDNTLRIPYEKMQTVGYVLASITEYRDAGVTLEVSVPCVENDLIVLDLNTIVSDQTGTINIGTNSQKKPTAVPTLDSRSIQNRLIIPDKTVFIAGLIKTTKEGKGKRGIPILGEIPFFGNLISNHKSRHTESELVFLVKAEILTPYREMQPINVAGGGAQ